MSRKSGDRRPYLPPVTRIELSEENIRSRWILLIVLVVVAAVAIGLGIHYATDVQPGWNEIQVACDEPNYAGEFHLMYDFSQTGGDAAAVNKALTVLYSDAMEQAYRIFSKDAQVEGVNNLHYLNDHPNEIVTVDAALYEALELLDAADNRCIFLAPVYVEYNRVFNSESDAEAMLYDPGFDPDAGAYVGHLMTYIADASQISLELMENCQVRLNVSEEYRSFAEEYGIEAYLDFAWMRNAFVTDYVADILVERGYTSGYLASFDGYTRSLEKAGSLDVNVFHRVGTDIYAPAKMTYEAPMSIVALRDHPLSDLDRWSYHVYEHGAITSSLIDPADGFSGTSISNLLCYSQSSGCAELLLNMIPALFNGDFEEAAMVDLKDRGIYAIWCQERTVYHTQEEINLETLENAQGIWYETSAIQ